MTALLTDAEALLRRAATPGAEAELYRTQSTTRTSEWSEGRPENLLQTVGGGYAVRLIRRGALGFGYGNAADGDDFEEVVGQARAALDHVRPEAALQLPESAAIRPSEDLELVDPLLMNSDFSRRAAFLRSVESQVRALDPRLTKVLRASYRETVDQSALVNSRGVRSFEEGTTASFSLACVAVDKGETQVGYGFSAVRHYADLDIEAVLRRTTRQALALLDGRPVPSGRYDLLLDPAVGVEMLDLLATALRADQTQRGKSFLAGRRGQTVGSATVTLWDHPHRRRGLGSAWLDAEGVPTAARKLVDRGTLVDYLYDGPAARREGHALTGNAGRSGYKGQPEPSASNFYLEPGSESPEALIGQTKRGLYVHQALGFHTVDTVSGDFSLGIMGEFVSDGALRHGVRGVTIGGNLLEFLKHLDAAGSDLTFMGGTGCPTLRVRDISVGGTS